MAAPRNETFGLQIDYASYVRTLDAIGQIALPKAAVGTLNLAALEAQNRLTAHAQAVFDRPVKFTETAFIVKLAKRGDVTNMESDVHAKQFQAEYLHRQIVGGTRKTGDDRRSGPHDLLVYAAKPTKHGGIPRRLTKALSKEMAKEKAARAAAAAAGTPYTKDGGIFFGTVRGVKGYWRRPKRPRATGPRKKGVTQTATTGKPTLILAVADEANYDPLFKYNEVVGDAYREFGSQRARDPAPDREVVQRADAAAAAAADTPRRRLRLPPAELARRRAGQSIRLFRFRLPVSAPKTGCRMPTERGRSHGMTVTPKRKPPIDDTIPLDDATMAELRDHWPRGRLDPAFLQRVGESLYGARAWRTEIAKDLARFRPRDKGGLDTDGALSHALIARWISEKARIPPWVGPALQELPSVALKRHRREAAEADAAMVRRMDDARRAWIQDLVPAYMVGIQTLPLPAAEEAPAGTKWPVAMPDDIDAAEDAGNSAYQAAAGLSDEVATPRPADPNLRMAWDDGWVQANIDHQKAFRGHVQRLTQAKAAARS